MDCIFLAYLFMGLFDHFMYLFETPLKPLLQGHFYLDFSIHRDHISE